MDIPIIDFSSYDEAHPETLEALGAQVNSALSELGFMAVRNVGMAPALLDELFAASEKFFSQNESDKRALGYSTAEENFGYQGLAEESLAPGSSPDLKEAITLCDLLSQRDRPWPDLEFRDLCVEFYEACLQAAYRIQRVFAAALQLDREYFVERHSGQNVTLRLLHYPPLSAAEAGQLGAGSHTDYGMVTLLFQDAVGGLEVLDKNDKWQAVAPIPGAVVINTGDLTERWTNGFYRSTSHRVRREVGQGDRYSIAFFVDPDSETRVECLSSCVNDAHPARYSPISAGEHILQKLQATHHAD